MFIFGNKGQFNFTKAERVLISVSMVIALFGCFALFNDDFSRMIFGLATEDSSKPILGRISYLENDTRHKSANTFAWGTAYRKQNIRLGDSVFTGEKSNAQVLLDKGSQVDLGQHTLVTFNEIDGMKMPNFMNGNFRLKVNGSVTVAIQGQVTKLEGKSSEVQIYLDAMKKPQVRVLKGQVSISEKKSPAKILEQDQIASLDKSASPSRGTAAEEKPVPLTPTLTPVPGSTNLSYTRRLYDIFEMNDTGGLEQRAGLPTRATFPHRFQWALQRGGQPASGIAVKGQLASSKDFFPHEVISFQSSGDSSTSVREVFHGDNYWRISLDGKSWSEPMQFRVDTHDLNASVQLYREQRENLVLTSGSVGTSLGIQTSQNMHGYVLEASTDPDFPLNSTQAHWFPRNVIGLTFKQPGHFYYRVRGVNAATEITAPSNVEEIIVELPPPRRLAGMSITKREALKIARENKPPAAVAKRKVLAEKPSKTVASQPHSTAGSLRRQPTSVSTSSIKASVVEQSPINQGYSSSKLEFESGAFTVYSPDEADIGRKNPMALIIGLRSHHWFGRSGLEASARVKAANSNDEAKGIDPLQIEGRYHYRINPNFLGRTQMSLFGGYEMYRNIGRGYFAQSYDLMKIGTAFDFPVKNRWDMGGEVTLGLGADSSKKYEISGRVNYYLQKDWSFGVGYRMYHFIAGSEKTAPLDFPYKETYGEGYSVLQWHY